MRLFPASRHRISSCPRAGPTSIRKANLVLHVLGGELRVEVASEELQLIGDAIFVSEGRILDENLFLD